ncbi:MAG: hypothetical protein JNL82_03840 [Myxococcales bacterium]|nr:hypothetical protein [Myxococcales bacterium]
MRGFDRYWLFVAGLAFTGACGDAGNATAEGGNTDSGTSSAGTSTGGGVPTSTSGDSLTGGGVTDSMTSTPTGPDTGNETVAPDTGDTVTETTLPLDTGNETVAPDTGSTAAPDTGTDTSAGTGTSSTGGDTDDPVVPCAGGKLWTLDADFDEGVLANVNHDAPNSDQLQITINGFSAPKPYMFVGQTSDGWILKIDTVTGKQLARYESVRLADCPTCSPSRQGWYPSRIIVDFDGDMYVANRAFGGQGSITKIAGSLASCIDRNNNGTIETSKDANNDGLIDVNSPAEHMAQTDECVLYTLPIGGVDMLPRALTLDGKGAAYVGTYSDMKGFKLDITTSPPTILETFPLPSTPYGFVVRGDYLYSSALGQPVMRIDLTDNYSVTTMNAQGNYGIAIDQNGIGWFGGYPLTRCDFDMGGDCQVVADIGSSGVAVDPDGDIWAAGDPTYKFSNNGTMLGTVNTPGGYGVAIGHDGNPRVIGAYAAYSVVNGGAGMPPGAVTTYSTDLPGNTQVYNYTYSDFTGFAAQNVTVKKGEWTVLHDSGVDATAWGTITHNNEPEGNVPLGTSITFQARAADTPAEVALKPWNDVIDDVPVGVNVGRYLELRARLLISDDMVDVSPVLSDVCLRAD